MFYVRTALIVFLSALAPSLFMVPFGLDTFEKNVLTSSAFQSGLHQEQQARFNAFKSCYSKWFKNNCKAEFVADNNNAGYKELIIRMNMFTDMYQKSLFHYVSYGRNQLSFNWLNESTIFMVMLSALMIAWKNNTSEPRSC